MVALECSSFPIGRRAILRLQFLGEGEAIDGCVGLGEMLEGSGISIESTESMG